MIFAGAGAIMLPAGPPGRGTRWHSGLAVCPRNLLKNVCREEAMRLGYLTELTEAECGVASEIGFDCIEVRGGWDAQSLGDASYVSAWSQEAKELLEKNGITVSAVALYHFAPGSRAQRLKQYEGHINLCRALDVDVLTTMAAADPERTLEENLDEWQALFREVVKRAEDAGVKIAFENWPGLRSILPPITSVNLAFTPGLWEELFSRVESDCLGLEFDPSHLVWQFIDWPEQLRKFSGRVYHVHAKDTEIFHDKLSAGGFFSGGWWRYRIPGYGVVDWHKFTSILKESGYDGGICIEHEDPVFSGERRVEGLLKGHQTLRPLV